MKTELYWVPGPWSGRLAIMPRPRGGDWLEDEIQSWRRSGVDIVASLLTADESAEMNLASEAGICNANGIEFYSFPILDRGVPTSRAAFAEFLMRLADHMADHRNVAVHCRQGIGRAALAAIGLLVLSGMRTDEAVREVSSARGCPVPETQEQRRWITDFDRSLAGAA